MNTPYGLQITENCVLCKLRQSGFFCDLPKASLEHLEKIKYASAFPQGGVLFVEGQAPRGSCIYARAGEADDHVARWKNADSADCAAG